MKEQTSTQPNKSANTLRTNKQLTQTNKRTDIQVSCIVKQTGVSVIPGNETERHLQELVYTSSVKVLTHSRAASNNFTSQPGNQLTGTPVNQQTSLPVNQP